MHCQKEIAMLTKKDVFNTLRQEYDYLAKEYGVKRIGVFGSYSNGTYHEKSDIDLMVEFGRPVGLKFVHFCDYLEDILGKKVDVLTPWGCKSIRIKEVAQSIQESIIYVEM